MLLPPIPRRSWLPMAILLLAGYAGNYFSLPLFFGVDFLFGSIAVLLVVRFFGIRWGTFAAAIASVHTFFLWNHPYAAIVLIGEALFVGLLWRNQKQSLVLLDVLYWLVLGIPLVWLFYSRLLHVDSAQTWLVVLKQSVNGIFNSIIASLAINYFPISTSWMSRYPVRHTPSMRQVLLSLCATSCFLPALILVVLDCNLVFQQIQTAIQVELKDTAQEAIAGLEDRQREYFNTLTQLSQVAGNHANAPSPQLQQSLELLQRVYPELVLLQVIDATDTIVASASQIDPALTSPGKLDAQDIKTLKQIETSLKPAIGNVRVHSTLKIPQLDLGVPILTENRLSGVVYAHLNLSYLENFLRSQLSHRVHQIILLDSYNRIIASSNSQSKLMQTFDRLRGGEMRSLSQKTASGNTYFENTYLWLPPKEKLPAMVRWRRSLYVKEQPLSGNSQWKLILEIPAAPYIDQLQQTYINDLAFMLATVLIILICGLLLSRKLANPLTQLATVTTDLSSRLPTKTFLQFPTSSVVEINSLIGNFQFMTVALNEKFQEVQAANQSLQERVQERTKELLRTNQQLEREINERQQANVALRESEERYRDLFENASDLIQSVTPDGRLVYVNRAWKETLDYSEDEISRLTIFDIIHPDNLEHCQKTFREVMAGKQISEIETAFVTKHGEKIWVAGSINCKFINGQPIATRGIFRNITERKLAEAEMIYALEKEKQLVELKSRFITTASHEFRTPLTTILMSAKLLEQFGDRASEDKKRLYLDRIQIATKRMTQLLDDILLIGKAEAEKLEFNPTPVLLEKFCHDLVEEMQMSASNKHSIIFTSQAQQISANVDEKLLRYILSNLLSNAIKYSPKGGDIDLNLSIEAEKAIFYIRDRGIGIPTQDTEQLFHSFHRGSNVENISGTGLGMSIVKQCVDLHGGEISVTSEVGIGTTFVVTLPI
ncbi:ATP-binding protein [Scytonema millei]|uniref:histidine kinase n=1 Tax=Scytonema millei VB511283 TaxID=1245923 RepID=A0A9X5I5X0_9CYAN|nr:ATP-binding protein [Scytonema millei]NHC36973.1 PAS domain S-box protein [Scytonema millei VB511283]